MSTSLKHHAPLLLSLFLALAACDPEPREPEVAPDTVDLDVTEDPAGPAAGDPPFERFAGTTDPLEVATERTERVALTGIRAATEEAHDRIVFEFEAEELPGYEIGYLEDAPRDCDTGETVEVAGERHLLVRLAPLTGGEGLAEARRSYEFPVVRALAQTCDRDGTVDWVVGVAGTAPYRVLELDAPVRLIVDLRVEG